MGKGLLGGWLALVLLGVNGLVCWGEGAWTQGRSLFLELSAPPTTGAGRPLAYAIGEGPARDAFLATPDLEGTLVLSVDANGIASYVRLYRGEELNPAERLLNFRLRGGLYFGADHLPGGLVNSRALHNARYAEVWVSPRGEVLDVLSLRDSSLQKID